MLVSLAGSATLIHASQMKERPETLDRDLERLKAAFSEISRLSAQVAVEGSPPSHLRVLILIAYIHVPDSALLQERVSLFPIWHYLILEMSFRSPCAPNLRTDCRSLLIFNGQFNMLASSARALFVRHSTRRFLDNVSSDAGGASSPT